MPLFFVLLLAPIAVAIALYRRNPRRFLDGPTEDAPLRLLRWAVGLLSAHRTAWGKAMLGELAHLDGRVRRMRFALGCTGAALILPPWGRRAAGLAALSAGLLQLLYATVAVAILGGGGPPDEDGGFTVRGTVSDRLANNIVDLVVGTLIIAMVGWAAAALAGYLVRRTPT